MNFVNSYQSTSLAFNKTTEGKVSVYSRLNLLNAADNYIISAAVYSTVISHKQALKECSQNIQFIYTNCCVMKHQ